MIRGLGRRSVIVILFFIILVYLIHAFWILLKHLELTHFGLVDIPTGHIIETAKLEALLQLEGNGGSDVQVAKHNRKVLNSLVDCITQGTCSKNQSKLIILDSPEFLSAFREAKGDDEYYAGSFLQGLDRFNVSYIFSPQAPLWAASIYEIFQDFVHAVLLRKDAVADCFSKKAGTCVDNDDLGKGIPPSKIFLWSRDDQNVIHSPLGPKWSLVGAPFSGGQTYLGFDFEQTCDELPFVDQTKRVRQAWINANLETYFWKTHNIFPHEYFERAGNASSMGIVAALDETSGRLDVLKYPYIKGIVAVPTNLKEINGLNAEQRRLGIAESKILIGLYDPKELTQPYEALCMGVPYLNPIESWDKANPSNRNEWEAQSAILKYLNPPYVYNVFRGNETAFAAAIQGSIDHPIHRYLPPAMRRDSYDARLSYFLEQDWKAEAARLNRSMNLT